MEALDELGAVSILEGINLEMTVTFLARLKFGWVAVGEAADGLGIASVRTLSSLSWQALERRFA
jgi:hypothetical protein